MTPRARNGPERDGGKDLPKSGAASPLAAVAHTVSRGLMALVRIPAALIATLLDLAEDALAALRDRALPAAADAVDYAAWRVRPAGTIALVAAAAALALGASQFVDYRGIAVGGPQYEGEVGTVAPVPFTELEKTGSAHLYLMVPLAIAALVLVELTRRGRWRMGRAVSAIGLVGLAVSLAIDAPAGLDAGGTEVAYSGADPRLIEGFWAQVASSATLVVCGLMLAAQVRADGKARAGRRAGDRGGREREARGRRARSGSVSSLPTRLEGAA